jgi:hypothetical protein
MDNCPDGATVPSSFGPRMRHSRCGGLAETAVLNWIERADNYRTHMIDSPRFTLALQAIGGENNHALRAFAIWK